ncbi:MAG: flagellar basal body protein, partial [Albidovulum sp.]
MGLSTSLANALTGLTAASRRAEVVSSNVSNALTPGYARREVNLAAQSLGGSGAGVHIDSVTRSFNQFILNDRRLADADAGNAGLRTDFLSNIENAIGQPGTPGALTEQIAAFDAALVQAASRPDSQARLQGVFTTATAVADKFKSLTTTLQ